uniref:Glycosyltransferase 2-like domain-containing protein n=1 Tax=Ditylenchus dipsaci TaxID=166011 RepID=A0A915CRS9_9BILA
MKINAFKRMSHCVSVIFPFYDEHFSTLLRSAYSIINRSPPGVVKEVILVDDASTKSFLKEPLEDDTANAKHDQSILPDTFKFLSAASNFLATAEKKEQKVSAKKKFKAVKRWVALQTRKSEQRKKSADVIS